LTHDEWIVCVAHTKNGESIEPSTAAAVFTATVASVMRGVRVAALLQCSAVRRQLQALFVVLLAPMLL
jgi:hypothetical protein